MKRVGPHFVHRHGDPPESSLVYRSASRVWTGQTGGPKGSSMEGVMKGVVFLGDRKLELREFPDPTPGPRDVILEIKASGMCGSDLHNYRASAQPAGAVTGGIKREAGVIRGPEPRRLG